MRVLVLTPDGFGGHGGIALYVRNVLTALCAHESHPAVVGVPRVMPLDVGPLPAGLTWETRGVGGKGRYAAVSLIAGARRCDLVVCMHVNLLSLAYAVSAAHGVPLILFVYGLEVWEPTNKILANRLVGKTDALVSIRAHTTRMLKRWASLNGTSEYTLENAIRLDRYGVAPKSAKLVDKYGLAGKSVVLTMGRVEESYKGFDEVIEVLPRLVQREPKIVYVVAGGGYDLPRLREKARALGVSERVIFTGFVADEEKADYYRLADVYAMPGTGAEFDRYPLRFVFLEAMACGIPVVGCRPEYEDEANDASTLLADMVDPRNPDDIVRGILGALSEGRHRVPDALQRFSFPVFQRRLHRIVDEVLTSS